MPGAPNWAVRYPFVNGAMYSHASVEIDLKGMMFAGVVAISYDDPVTPGLIYGTGGVLIGRTPGTNKPTMSMTMLRRDWDYFLSQLVSGDSSDSPSYGSVEFDVTVTMHEEELPARALTPGVTADDYDQGPSQSQTTQDFMEGVRITGVAIASSAGSGDAAAVVLTCNPRAIRWGKGKNEKGALNLIADSPTGRPLASGQGAGLEGPEPDGDGGSGEWWGTNSAGFWAQGDRTYCTNPWDTFVVNGEQMPGLCKVTATPSQAIDRQKPNGSDAAALIVRGYVQAEISCTVTLWTQEHWVKWQKMIGKLWRRPNKASSFDRPELKKAAIPGQKQAPDNKAAKREIAAIDRSEITTKATAITIYHPSLAPLGILTGVITSISAPTPGSQPQTFESTMRLVEYIWAPPPGDNQTKHVTGSTNKRPSVDSHTSNGAGSNFAVAPANSPAKTPADTEGGPG